MVVSGEDLFSNLQVATFSLCAHMEGTLVCLPLHIKGKLIWDQDPAL